MGNKETFFQKIWPVLMFLLAIVVIWQDYIYFFKVPEYFIPSPFSIFQSIIENAVYLFLNALITFREMILGFTLGATTAFIFAISIFHSRTLNRTLYPSLMALNVIPKVTLVPLLVIWFGFDILPKIILIGIMSFFPVLINTTKGLGNVDPSLLDFMHTLSATKKQILLKVRLPSALPYIFIGLKTSILLSVTGAMISEFLMANKGLGYVILVSQANFNTSLMFGSIAVISIMGISLVRIISFIEKKVLFWDVKNNN